MRCSASVVKTSRCRHTAVDGGSGLCFAHGAAWKECAICLRTRRTGDGWCQLRCGHGFCELCLFQWNRVSDTCPLCRAPCFGGGGWWWMVPLCGVFIEVYLAYMLGTVVGGREWRQSVFGSVG